MERVQQGLKNPRASLDTRSEFVSRKRDGCGYEVRTENSSLNRKTFSATLAGLHWQIANPLKICGEGIQPRLKNRARIFSPGKSEQIQCNRKEISSPTPNLVPKAHVVSPRAEKPAWMCAVILFSRNS